jgi:hypothetical protein
MDANIMAAVISAASSMVVAVTAPVLNHRGFADLRCEMNVRLGALERRLDVLESDLKELYKVLMRRDTDIARIKDKANLN